MLALSTGEVLQDSGKTEIAKQKGDHNDKNIVFDHCPRIRSVHRSESRFSL
jgi:hypothetical protein